MSKTTKPAARFTTREDARRILSDKVARMSGHVAAIERGESLFITFDPAQILADAVERLRWIDCAPEGANHLVAPMQDKTGTPMGDRFSENLGPGRSLRDARARRGLGPFGAVAA